MIRRSILPGLVLALAAGAPARAADADGPVALRGAVIETAGKAGRIADGTVLVRGGKIEAVGTDVKVPDDARVIDVHGLTIMPGLIDPFREVTLVETAADTTPRPVTVRGRTFPFAGVTPTAPAVFSRVADNFYPYAPGYRPLVRSGLTGLNLVTTGYGRSAVVRVTPGAPDGMLTNPDGFLFAAVTNDTTSLDVVRNGLEAAERAKKGLPAMTPSAPAGGTPSGAPTGRRFGGGGGGGRRFGGGMGGFGGGGTPAASLPAWQDVYDGKAPLLINAANAAAIVHLLKILAPYKDVKLVLAAPGPALYETLDLLTTRPLRVLVRPELSLLPNTRDRVALPRLLHEAGVEFAFMHAATVGDPQVAPDESSFPAAADAPLFPVAYLVRCGLPRQAALQALTARPAALLGLDKTHGTIEPGKSADLLLFTGDPLDPASQLARVLIEGRTVHEN
jgi:hypothetical protein